VVFQPHRFSRTALLREEFGTVWGDAARVWVLDVYAAGEAPIPGISGQTVVDSACAAGARHISFASTADAIEQIAAESRPGDVVITLGAGDVWKLGDAVLERLRQRAGVAGGSRT
jgi:UDP-N-acetylmuramate--alanine ligase